VSALHAVVIKSSRIFYMKKTFVISSILLFIILVFLGIYNFVFKKNSPSLDISKDTNSASVPENKPAPDSEKTEKPKGKIYSISQEAVVAPALDKTQDRIIYYTQGIGNVYEIYLDGSSKRTLSSKNLPDLKNVSWSPEKDQVLSMFRRDSKTYFSFYDYVAKSGKELNGNITAVAWSNLGDKIFYAYSDTKTKQQSFNISNPDGSDWKRLADAFYGNIEISPIPQTSFASFWNSPNGFEETSLRTISITGGEAKTIFSGRFGADFLWSPNGSRALVSSSETKGGSKIMLATINVNGGEYQNLNIPTLASKCVWSSNNKTIFYALPGFIPDGSVMPNDYQDKKVTTKDTFWKADVTTGKKERIIELDDLKSGFDATDLFLSAEENILFFTNRLDGKLYRIDL
jgi:hypothetical protein